MDNIWVFLKRQVGEGYEYTGQIDVMSVYPDAGRWAKLLNPSIFDCYTKWL